jgi:hypothetical protein
MSDLACHNDLIVGKTICSVPDDDSQIALPNLQRQDSGLDHDKKVPTKLLIRRSSV